MVQTYAPQTGQDISQGLSNLGSIFAPPTAQQLVAQQTIAASQQAAAQKAAALAAVSQQYGSGIGALYGTGDNDAISHGLTYQQYQNSQAPSPNITKLDLGNYALHGDAKNTFLGQQAAPLNENQSRMLPPALAAALGVPQQQQGVVSLGDDSKMLPGSGQTQIVTAPDTGQDDERKWGVVGKDKFGNPQYGYPPRLDPSNPAAQVPGGAAPPAGAADSAAPQDLHGDDFIKTLPTDIAGQVRSIVQGRTPYPTGMLLKTPYGQQLATYVRQADPAYESGNAAARNKTRNEFETGGSNSPAGAITALNTMVGHLSDLSDASEQLGGSQFKVANQFENLLRGNYGGTPGATALTQYNNALNAYAQERGKFYSGAGGTESERQLDRAILDPSMPLDQRRAAMQQQVQLFQAKAGELQARWHNAMGPMNGDFPMLTPTSQSAIDRIGQRANSVPGLVRPSAGAPQAAAAPTAQSSVAAGPGGSGSNAAANASGAAPAAPAGSPSAAQPPAQPPAPAPAADPISAAKAAIARGAPRDAVLQRLQQAGINISGTGL